MVSANWIRSTGLGIWLQMASVSCSTCPFCRLMFRLFNLALWDYRLRIRLRYCIGDSPIRLPNT